MRIDLENNQYKLTDNTSWEEEQEGELKEVFRDGKLLIKHDMKGIRGRVRDFS